MDFYGWPWFYAGGNEDPTLPGKHPELKFQSIVPDVLLQPHSAPIQLAFYDGTQFPSAYRRDIFVISSPGSSATRRLTARRADVPQASVTAEGSLLVADDLGNTIWRVRTRSVSSDRRGAH